MNRRSLQVVTIVILIAPWILAAVFNFLPPIEAPGILVMPAGVAGIS